VTETNEDNNSIILEDLPPLECVQQG